MSTSKSRPAAASKQPRFSTIAEFMSLKNYNGHSMVSAMQRVVVCSPRNAGCNCNQRVSCWRELGFSHPPEFETAQAQHEALCRELEECGAEVLNLPGSSQLSLDAVYTHDASLPTDYGLILIRPGKSSRVPEVQRHRAFCQLHGMPVLGGIQTPRATEAVELL